MEDSINILKQLKVIKWTILFIAASVLVAVTTISYSAYATYQFTKDDFSDSACNKDNFRDLASTMINENKLEDVIGLANERVKQYPNDQDVFWYRGIAYYLQGKWQLAIDDFNRVEKLAPSWKNRYVEPYRTTAQSKLQKNEKIDSK